VSSFQEHLERTGGRDTRPPTQNLGQKDRNMMRYYCSNTLVRYH